MGPFDLKILYALYFYVNKCCTFNHTFSNSSNIYFMLAVNMFTKIFYILKSYATLFTWETILYMIPD